MRFSKIWTISLPPAMEKEVSSLAKLEHRTRSELVREALRVYLAGNQWKMLQKKGAVQAQHLGIRSEADVEKLIDDLRR